MQTISHDILIQSIESSNLAHSISLIEEGLPLTYVNQAFLDQTGYTRDEIIGHNCRFLQGEGTDPAAVDRIRHAIANHLPIEVEILNYKKDGTPFWNQLRMAPVFDGEQQPVAFIGIQSDVTRLREQERTEQERQKLEALGRMSANISHEIKNALQPIGLMADVLSDWEGLPDEQRKKSIRILNDNIAIAQKVAKETLRFSRKTEDALEQVAVGTIVDDVTQFIQNLTNSRTDFVADIGDITEEDQVGINPNQLHQILLNLVNNANYAMGDTGTLTLTVKNLDITDILAAQHQVATGAYLSLSLTDSGCGMDEATMRSIFDPFFSTKPMGEGTGLGLSISHRMVHEWGGVLTVTSKLGQGSTFSILLPLNP